jgi:translation initiation factor 4E
LADADCDMYLFKEGLKPEWEDPSNSGGGFFKMKVDKKKANKFWENAIFSMISPKNKYVDIMNGIRMKIRENYDELELWMNKAVADKEKLEGFKNYLKENVQITD